MKFLKFSTRIKIHSIFLLFFFYFYLFEYEKLIIISEIKKIYMYIQWLIKYIFDD